MTLSNILVYSPRPTSENLASISKTSYFHIRNIRIDYCNSLLLGLSDKLVQRLQRIQNIAAITVTRCERYDHITPILKELHWLPVIKRVQFKTPMITHKALNDQAQIYLTELLHEKVNTRTLRPSGEQMLAVPQYKLQTYGQRCCANNKLPKSY